MHRPLLRPDLLGCRVCVRIVLRCSLAGAVGSVAAARRVADGGIHLDARQQVAACSCHVHLWVSAAGQNLLGLGLGLG